MKKILLLCLVAILLPLGASTALAAKGGKSEEKPAACPPASPNAGNPQPCGHVDDDDEEPCSDANNNGICDEEEETPACVEDGLDAFKTAPLEGVASGVVHTGVEPAVTQLSPDLAAAMHTVNCEVVVAVEDGVDGLLAGG